MSIYVHIFICPCTHAGSTHNSSCRACKYLCTRERIWRHAKSHTRPHRDSINSWKKTKACNSYDAQRHSKEALESQTFGVFCFNCFHSLAASFKTSLLFMSGYLSLDSGIFSFKKMLYALGRTFFFSPGSTTFFLPSSLQLVRPERPYCHHPRLLLMPPPVFC